MIELKKDVQEQVNHSVRIRTVAWVLLIVSLVLSAALFFVSGRVSDSFDRMQEATDIYLTCQQATAQLLDGSNYLTVQVRSFAVTADSVYANNYFHEAGVTRRRERAQFTLEKYINNAMLVLQSQEILAISNELMIREYYIMRLTIEGSGQDVMDYPIELHTTELTAADKALSPEEMRQLAIDLAYGDTYSYYRQEIDSKTQIFLDSLLTELDEERAESEAQLLRAQRWNFVVVFLFLLAVVSAFGAMFKLVVLPLLRSSDIIEDQKFLPIRGAWEMRLLAANYNRILEKTLARQEQLSYAAEHDALTGAYSRAIFDKFCEQTQEDEPIAMLLVDLDHFKKINDSFGHSVGDRVLKKAAALLIACFRSDDLVCRIGGDEFAAILFNMGPENREVLESKLFTVIDQLKHPEEGDLPSSSLSIGVVFGSSKNAKELHVNADTAMYRAKKAGRGTVVFFDQND